MAAGGPSARLAVAAAQAPALVTSCGALWPATRVLCVGRNYEAHAAEMGGDPSREPPFFFAKGPFALCSVAGSGAPGAPPARLPYPPSTSELHHEVELAVAVGGDSGGRALSPSEAAGLVWGYGAALDLTRRDLQAAAKGLRRPWFAGKDFECAAPVSELVEARGGALAAPLASGAVWLSVNGQQRQAGDLADMVWGVPELLAHASRITRLRPGDVVLTGTPAGVGPVRRGDVVEAGVEGVASMRVTFD